MFNKVIVANRGAVASRVLSALRALRVRTVAVYSDADAGLPYLAQADETFCIGAPAPAASYLNQELLIEVLKTSGADGLHPGYGFLSENAAFAERVKFSAFLVFVLLWATFVYDPLAHWVWGVKGWMREMGVLDFAGGTVVHISSGASALVAAYMFGRRLGYPQEAMPPHNLPFSVIGAGLLWVGWFGCTAGSALAADGLATSAFVATHIATAGAAISWLAMDWIFREKPTVLGVASGAVAGLVAITPGSGFVGPMSALCIGIGGGVLCSTACSLKPRLGYDDSLDVVGVHGVGGIWGALATGLFASKTVNAAGNNGLFFGNPGQLWIQIVSIIATVALAMVGTFIILSVLKALMGLRVAQDEERMGLDLSQHNERAYE